MMFALTKTLLLASLALSASALSVGNHAARSPAHHHAIAARHAAPAVMNPVSADKPLQRRLSRRARRRTCRPPTSSAAPSATPVPSSSVVVAPAPAPTAVTSSSSSVALTTSTENAPQPTTSTVEVPTTSSSATPTEVPTTSSTAAPEPTTTPTTTRQAPTTTSTPTPTTTTQQAPAPSPTPDEPTGEVFEGDVTYFDTGLGACGINNQPGDFIAAVSKSLFDSWPGYKGDNPNANPICKKKIRVTYEDTSIDVIAVDRCDGCRKDDLDLSTGAFAALSKGRIDGRGRMKWRWIN